MLFQSVYIGGSFRNLLKNDILLVLWGSEPGDDGSGYANYEFRVQQLEAKVLVMNEELKADHVRLKDDFDKNFQQLEHALMSELRNHHKSADTNLERLMWRRDDIQRQNEDQTQNRTKEDDERRAPCVLVALVLLLFIALATIDAHDTK